MAPFNDCGGTRHGPYHLYVLSSMANAEGGAYRFTCPFYEMNPVDEIPVTP